MTYRARCLGRRHAKTPTQRKRARAYPVDASMIMRDLWPSTHERPWWAKLAYKRGWMTAKAYYAVEQTERVFGIYDAMYTDTSPLFAMLPKEPFFAGATDRRRT